MNDVEDDLTPEELAAALELDQFDPFDRSPGSAVSVAHAVRWRDLLDEDARAEWAALRDWVEWATVRYDIPEVTVPTCWWRHGALVEELSALHTAWRAAFDAADAGFGPIGWHERLALARGRLKAAYPGSCQHGHQARKPRSWVGATDESEWDAWTSQAHAR